MADLLHETNEISLPHSLSHHADTARDWLQRAGHLLDTHYIEEAQLALRRADALATDDASLYRALTIGYQVAGLPDEAACAEMAALAYEQHSALMLYNLATSYLMTQRPMPAERWYRAALRLAPEMIAAHQNLASIMERDGRREEAAYHRDKAYRQQSIFIDSSENAKRTVLILCASATGNVPFDFLFPSAATNRIKWVMDYACEEQIAHLPAYDIVFNAIGDQDVTGRSSNMVERFLSQCRKPVLNPPQRIVRTARDGIPALLADIDRVVVPDMIRLHHSVDVMPLASKFPGKDIAFPVLVRPAGSHGGDGLRLFDTKLALDAVDFPAGEYYACHYYDYRSTDGYYRKYRVIFIDRQPYPYHLAISENWLVHYVSADMLAHQWKRDEELRYLSAPDMVLGQAVMQALQEIGKRLDLDFCGIDFSVLPDGQLLVFEANATMLVHPEDYHPVLHYKNVHVQDILGAFDRRVENLIVN